MEIRVATLLLLGLEDVCKMSPFFTLRGRRGNKNKTITRAQIEMRHFWIFKNFLPKKDSIYNFAATLARRYSIGKRQKAQKSAALCYLNGCFELVLLSRWSRPLIGINGAIFEPVAFQVIHDWIAWKETRHWMQQREWPKFYYQIQCKIDKSKNVSGLYKFNISVQGQTVYLS